MVVKIYGDEKFVLPDQITGNDFMKTLALKNPALHQQRLLELDLISISDKTLKEKALALPIKLFSKFLEDVEKQYGLVEQAEDLKKE
jgi:hypothetical protein